jgi:hypothetical protein
VAPCLSDIVAAGEEREGFDAEIGRLREELDEGALGSAWAGRQMTADEAVRFALSE